MSTVYHPASEAAHPSVLAHGQAGATRQDTLNFLQQHVCNIAYCKKGDPKKECCFRIPESTRAKTGLSFKEHLDGNSTAKIRLRRNDRWPNSYNPVMLEFWRANIDLQVLVDVGQTIEYMAKYTTKTEKSSAGFLYPLRKIAREAGSDTSAAIVLRKAMMGAFGGRDNGAEEVAHLNLSLGMVKAKAGGRAIRFVQVNLNPDQSKQINKAALAGDAH